LLIDPRRSAELSGAAAEPASASDEQLVAVTKRFGPTVAVDAIDAEIPGGTYCCLPGPSGCSKTTMLRMIAGHERPTRGEIAVGGVNVTHLPPARRHTAMMVQHYALFPHLNCLDNMAFSLGMRGVPKAARHEKAHEMLRLVEMEAQARRLQSQLPGGQQQPPPSLSENRAGSSAPPLLRRSSRLF
jgi:putative spermidine/putrescine transport system ATP-binding protein